MASIRERARKDGGTSYTLTWRDPDAGLKSRTFTDAEKAQELKDFLDANGNSFKLAAKAKVRKDSTAPTVSEVVVRHIDLLRKPQPRDHRQVPEDGRRAHRLERPRPDAGGQGQQGRGD